MSNKPLWYTGLIVVAAGVIWWGLSVQDRSTRKKQQDLLEEKIKTYRVFIVEQEQLIKNMNNELKSLEEKPLSDQYARMKGELSDLTVKSPNDVLGRERLMTDMTKVQVKLDALREQKKVLKNRIESFRESVVSSKATLAESEKKLSELRGKKDTP